jgi:hypothetical protein
MGAETQNCAITVFRGTSTNWAGDQVDSNVPYITDLPATLIETGKSVQDPSTPTPRTIRAIYLNVPEWAGLLTTDRVLDQRTQDIYIVISVTKPGTIIGAPVDTVCQLKRVSANAA